jgi:hypothetical protein
MKRLVLWAPLGLLFACSGSAVSLQPGQWESTVRFSNIEMPGAPPEALAQMRAMLGQPRTNSECMTAAQAANPMGSLMNPGGSAGECQFPENTFAGGAIRVRATCTAAGRGTMNMTLQGSYTATTMEAQVTSDIQAPPGLKNGPQSIRMTGTMTGRRTGDCPSG